MSCYTSIEQVPATLNAEELAKALNISMSSSYRLMHSKGFPVVKIGKRRMVTKHDLLKWMSQQVAHSIN